VKILEEEFRSQNPEFRRKPGAGSQEPGGIQEAVFRRKRGRVQIVKKPLCLCALVVNSL
jgi:hypothetical protein